MGRADTAFFVTGEPSGDRHSAPVVADLVQRGFSVRGVGGPAMREAGADLLADSTTWGGLGLPDSLRRAPGLFIQRGRLLAAIRKERPSVVVLVDFGAFNVRLAAALRGAGDPPVFYYFPPGSWRQEPRDWSRLAALTDRIATPFARNAEYLRQSGADAHFVGHPVLDSLNPPPDRAALRREMGLGAPGPYIGLLPGSRGLERATMSRLLLDAAEVIRARMPGAQFLWSRFPSADRLARDAAARVQTLGGVSVLDDSHAILRACDLAIVAMGTVTVEATACLTPMVAAFDTGFIAKWIAGHILHQKQPLYAMPNLLAGRMIVPEAVPRTAGDRVTPERIAEPALDLLASPAQADAMRAELLQVRAMLGTPGVARRTSDLIVDLARSRAMKAVGA
ncbi:MAG: hypothetical protein QM473_02160 [Acidobacteriota bacterium]|nr:hypothetical protein [Acidobacteriota bacterium]